MNETPKHIAIIMDGNGRWAKQRRLPRLAGHREGANAVKRTIEAAQQLGVKFLTLYAFSTENWSRPKEEIDGLMDLLCKTLDTYTGEAQTKNYRLLVSGAQEELPPPSSKKLKKPCKPPPGTRGLPSIWRLITARGKKSSTL